jgi:beta-N-acetylhexosaminidase
MRLEELAARCLFPSFAGVAPPEWVRRLLGEGLGGLVLFAGNVRDSEQVAALTAALRAGREDVLVAIDEEGGDVTRLEGSVGSSYPGNHALGAVDDIELTERVGAAIGSDLARAGVNLALAPVADVNSNPLNPVIGVRAFGSEPNLVARHTAAFVRGMQGCGVAACAKHFPGHGATEQDSHLELPTVGADRATLLAVDALPFKAAVGAGVRSIMTAHVRVPAFDDVPATLSPVLLQGLLREELGFEGMVVTDALEMRALSGTVEIPDGAVAALAAGADALLLGRDVGPEWVDRVRRAVVEAVRSGELPEERLAEAAARVSATARWASRPAADPASDSALGLEAARRAVVVEGEVELSSPPLVVELWPEALIAAGEARHGPGDALRSRLPGTEIVRIRERVTDLSTEGRSVVLVLRDAHRHAWQREVAEAVLAASPDAVVVETGLPVWRPAAAAGYLATHGAGRVNLEAAAERLVPGRPGYGQPRTSAPRSTGSSQG